MITKLRKLYDIELDPNELHVLNMARTIIEEIVDSASEEKVIGFKIANDEDYSLQEVSNCMVLLDDLCYPTGRLEGYFNEYEPE